ncbi:hypothetical protein GW17_00054988 [Ensete ventricosum]|nr:hypothetical protein GW17_00054988 [Ensete ventricosum]
MIIVFMPTQTPYDSPPEFYGRHLVLLDAGRQGPPPGLHLGVRVSGKKVGHVQRYPTSPLCTVVPHSSFID